MKLTSSNETLAENKVLILYILDKIARPISNDDLYRLVLDSQEMNYFYFQQFLLDLIETKYIKNYINENESIYEITEIGKNALVLVEDLLPGIVKLKTDGTLKTSLNIIEEENSISAEYIPISKNEYSVKCKIVESNKTLFEVSTYAGSREQAKNITDNWNKNAIDIYPKLLNLLNENIEDN